MIVTYSNTPVILAASGIFMYLISLLFRISGESKRNRLASKYQIPANCWAIAGMIDPTIMSSRQNGELQIMFVKTFRAIEVGNAKIPLYVVAAVAALDVVDYRGDYSREKLKKLLNRVSELIARELDCPTSEIKSLIKEALCFCPFDWLNSPHRPQSVVL